MNTSMLVKSVCEPKVSVGASDETREVMWLMDVMSTELIDWRICEAATARLWFPSDIRVKVDISRPTWYVLRF